GHAYVTGSTDSTDFPTQNALQGALAGGSGFDAFVTKLGPAGNTLVYSTYLGGTFFDGGQAIAVDSSGNAYLTGRTGSGDFPVTANAFQSTHPSPGNNAVFVTVLNAAGGARTYSTYLGGTVDD